MLQKIANKYLEKEAKSFAAYGAEALADLWKYIQKRGVSTDPVAIPNRLRKRLFSAFDAYRGNTKGRPITKQLVTPKGVVPNKHYDTQLRRRDGYRELVHYPTQFIDNPNGGKLVLEGRNEIEYIPGRYSRLTPLTTALGDKGVDVFYDNRGINFVGKTYKKRIPKFAEDGYPSYQIDGKTIFSDEPRWRQLPFWHDDIEYRQHKWSPVGNATSKTFSWDDFNKLLRQSGIIK